MLLEPVGDRWGARASSKPLERVVIEVGDCDCWSLPVRTVGHHRLELMTMTARVDARVR